MTPLEAHMLKRFLLIVSLVFVTAAFSRIEAPVAAAQQPPAAQKPPTEGQSEFVPVSELPPADQLRAAPLLIAAYAFVWIAVLFYVWTIWRRLNKVEHDMETLARRSQTR